MVFIKVCVGSSCHLKGAPEIVALMEEAIRAAGLEDKTVLYGSLCAGKCNRIGVTVAVNDDVYSGITRENFQSLWDKTVMKAVSEDL